MIYYKWLHRMISLSVLTVNGYAMDTRDACDETIRTRGISPQTLCGTNAYFGLNINSSDTVDVICQQASIDDSKSNLAYGVRDLSSKYIADNIRQSSIAYQRNFLNSEQVQFDFASAPENAALLCFEQIHSSLTAVCASHQF